MQTGYGYYLYCVRERMNTPPPVTHGIGGSVVNSLCIQTDLEAVISEVDAETFDPDEIQKKAREDVGWIKKNAQLHEQVIEQTMRGAAEVIAVIPMKFGTIFKTKESLNNSLTNHYQQFKDSLEKLQGKQEWGVKVYLKENLFRRVVAEKNEVVLTKKKEIEAMPKGIAFFAQKQIDAVVKQAKDKEIDRITAEIYENLGQLALSKVSDKLLEKDFTGRSAEMILNIFYLIEESKAEQLQKKVEEFKEKYGSRGFAVEMTGPWPSYHFA